MGKARDLSWRRWGMMEGVKETHKASQLAPEDVISSMPDTVIANIMNRLPIQDAVRTGVLARKWRLKWTLLTELIFDSEISKCLVTLGPDGKQRFDSRIISRLLLVLKGQVTKFVLYIRHDQILDVGDLNHWVLFLSGKGIKEFTLVNIPRKPLRLPIHLFSCVELTHLKLQNCLFHPSPTFCGFPNLLSLELSMVRFESCKCWEFLTRSPLLEIMDIFVDYSFYPLSNISLYDISKLENLKKLTLSVSELKNRVISTSSIFHFLGFLPKLEELLLDFLRCKFVVEDVTRDWLPIAFPCLNTLTLFAFDFRSRSMLSCVFRMVWGSPNLQELRISCSALSGADDFYLPPTALFTSGLDSNTVGQLQLQSVEIKHFSGSMNEVCFMKHLLACSPFLRRIAIYSLSYLKSDEKLKATMELLKLHRASPVAQVDFYDNEY